MITSGEKRQVSFRLSDEEWHLLKTIIYNESMKRGELVSKTEYIKSCLFRTHLTEQV